MSTPKLVWGCSIALAFQVMTTGWRNYKRVKRFDVPYGVHALTFSCHKRKPLLTKHRTRQYFCDAVIRAKATHGFHVWAYVIMPEHVHLLLWFPHEDYVIADALKSIKQSVARRAVRYLRINNPGGLRVLATGDPKKPYAFWLDGGGFDHNVSDVRALGAYIDYIHNNPVVRGLCLYAEEWEWSSAADWNGLRAGPIPLDKNSLGV